MFNSVFRNNPRFKAALRTHLLTILTVVAVAISIIIGIVMRIYHDKYDNRTVMYVNFLGDIFLRMIRALILPLIISSLIAAIAPLDVSLSKKIGIRSIVYILTTTVIAVILGIVLVVTIKPGIGNSDIGDKNKVDRKGTTIVDTILDLIRNIFPPNLVQATLQTYQTQLTTNDTDLPVTQWNISGKYVDGTNMLGVVSSAIIMGIAMSIIREKIPILIKVILEFTNVMMLIIQWV